MNAETKLRLIRTYRLAKRLAALREAGKPITGAYYWIPTPEGWNLMVYPEDFYPDKVHDQLWRASAAERVAEAWNLSSDQLRELKQIPYCVPRGRVSEGYGSNSYYLSHGNDTPVPNGLLKVISEMNLGALKRAGRLNISEDEHEHMISQHELALKRLIPQIKESLTG